MLMAYVLIPFSTSLCKKQKPREKEKGVNFVLWEGW